MKKRWLVLGVSWIVFFVAFLDRVNLSVAMPLISKEFSLSPEQVGYLFSAFFISYTVFQIPGGYLSDKVGPKKVLLVALVWWSIMTMATGVARTFSQFFIVRVLFGIGEGLVEKDYEQTLRNIGRMGCCGMKTTDVEILNIMIGN